MSPQKQRVHLIQRVIQPGPEIKAFCGLVCKPDTVLTVNIKEVDCSNCKKNLRVAGLL